MRFAVLALLLLAFGCSRQEPPAGTTAGMKGADAALTPESLAQQADVPLYPGAEVPSGRSRAPYETPSGEMRYEILMETPDPVAKVMAFYKDKVQEMGEGGPMIAGKSPKGNDVLIGVTRQGKVTTIKVNAIAYQKK